MARREASRRSVRTEGDTSPPANGKDGTVGVFRGGNIEEGSTSSPLPSGMGEEPVSRSSAATGNQHSNHHNHPSGLSRSDIEVSSVCAL